MISTASIFKTATHHVIKQRTLSTNTILKQQTRKKTSTFKKLFYTTNVLFFSFTSCVIYSISDQSFYDEYLSKMPFALRYRLFLSETINNFNKEDLQSLVTTSYHRAINLLNLRGDGKALVSNNTADAGQNIQKIKIDIKKLNEMSTENNSQELNDLLLAIRQMIIKNNRSGGSTFEEASLIENLISQTRRVVTKTANQEKAVKEELLNLRNETELKARNLDQLSNELARIREEFEQNKLSLMETIRNKDNEISEEKSSRQSRFESELNEKIIQQKEQMERQFKREVKALVEKDKNYRLNRLDEIDQVSRMVKVQALKNNDLLNKITNIQKTKIILEDIEANRYNMDKKVIKKTIQSIKGNELIREIKDSLEEYFDTNEKIYTKKELKERFYTVCDEIRKSSLAESNNGFAGHLISQFTSALLFKKKGLVDGEDIESYISRAKHYLENNNIEYACRELNQLKGWPKLIANDYLKDCRTELEFDQNLKVAKLNCEFEILKLIANNEETPTPESQKQEPTQ